MPSASNRFFLNASWLLKLRWVAVIGQLITIAGAWLMFEIRTPILWAIVVVLALTVASNLYLRWWVRGWHQSTYPQLVAHDLVLGLVMVMDLFSLTVLLFVTGGPNNPFCLFYFVNLSLSALMLSRNWAWAINGLTILCFTGLMVEHYSLSPLDFGLAPLAEGNRFSIQHGGLLVAFSACCSVIVYFMTRLTVELQNQQRRVQLAQFQQAKAEKLEALGTLAAGAAHELATPLSTIAVVAKDVEQAFVDHPPHFPGAEEVVEDVHLIRNQLERCRTILDRMASHAGETIGETIQVVASDRLTHTCIEGLLEQDRIRLIMPSDAAQRILRVPLIGLSQAIRGIIQNALDADPSDRVVKISVSLKEASGVWTIEDQGSGMTESELARISEPFFTTKAPGKGMGLGIFLAKNVIERLGGSIQFDSQPGQGTRVQIQLPVEKA